MNIIKNSIASGNRINICGILHPDNKKLKIDFKNMFNADLYDEIFNEIFGYHVHSSRKTIEDIGGSITNVYKLTADSYSYVVKLSYVSDDDTSSWIEKDVYNTLEETKKRHHTIHIPVVPKGISPFEIRVNRYDANGENYIESGRIRCLVMECYENFTYKNKTDIRGALKITASILNDLACFHNKGWIHRDIKPQNIVKKGNQYIIIDWESAIIKDTAKTITTVMGTPYYTHPERYVPDGEGYIYEKMVQSDLYSVGIFILNLITSESEFKGLFVKIPVKAELEDMNEIPPEIYSLDMDSVKNLLCQKITEEDLREKVFAIIEKACVWKPEGAVKKCGYRTAGDMLSAVENVLYRKKAKRETGIIDANDVQTPIAFGFIGILAVLTSFICAIIGKCFVKGADIPVLIIPSALTLLIFVGLSFLYEKILVRSFRNKSEQRPCDRMSHLAWGLCSLISAVTCVITVCLASVKVDLSALPFTFYLVFSSFIALICVILNIMVKTQKFAPIHIVLWAFFAVASVGSFYSYLTLGGPDAMIYAILHSIILNIITAVLIIVWAVCILAIGFLICPKTIISLFWRGAGDK